MRFLYHTEKRSVYRKQSDDLITNRRETEGRGWQLSDIERHEVPQFTSE